MQPHPNRLFVCVLLAILMLSSACTSSNDSAADKLSQSEDGKERIFRDPADDGFAPVNPDFDPPNPDEDEIPDQLAMVATHPADLVAEMSEIISMSPAGEAVLDIFAPFETRSIANGSEAPVTIDQQALEACGNVEITLALVEALDDQALDHLVDAAHLVRQSQIAWSQEWGNQLEGTVLRGTNTDLAPLVAFLSVCVAGGYQL